MVTFEYLNSNAGNLIVVIVLAFFEIGILAYVSMTASSRPSRPRLLDLRSCCGLGPKRSDPMGERPLAIAVSALVRDDKILLIRRIKGSYAGLMGLPGGKIERNEHASDAAVREALEESGIESTVKRFMGTVSEHEVEDGRVVNHYLLFLFELEPKHTRISEGSEGKLEWCDLKEIGKMKDRIIPSDFEIICRLTENEVCYYNCAIEKAGGTYRLREFNQVG